MPLLRLLERLNAGRDAALERYYRDEHLDAELASLRAHESDHRQLTLERSLYAASSYFAA
jgi:hypothetical protein